MLFFFSVCIFYVCLQLYDSRSHCVCVLSSAESDRSFRRRQGPSSRPGPSASAEDHGPGCEPTGTQQHTRLCHFVIESVEVALSQTEDVLCFSHPTFPISSTLYWCTNTPLQTLTARLCPDVFSVCVGANDGRLQAQEQQNQRGTLPVSHLNSECVSEENPSRKICF